MSNRNLTSIYLRSATSKEHELIKAWEQEIDRLKRAMRLLSKRRMQLRKNIYLRDREIYDPEFKDRRLKQRAIADVAFKKRDPKGWARQHSESTKNWKMRLKKDPVAWAAHLAKHAKRRRDHWRELHGEPKRKPPVAKLVVNKRAVALKLAEEIERTRRIKESIVEHECIRSKLRLIESDYVN